MGSVGMIEMNGIKKLNCIEVHTCKKNNFLLINKNGIILFQFHKIKKSTKLFPRQRCSTETISFPPGMQVSVQNYSYSIIRSWK